MIKGFLKGSGKWLIIIPAIALLAVIVISGNRQDAVTGYRKIGSNVTFALGVATFSLPSFVPDFLEAKVYVDKDAKGLSTVGSDAQAKAAQTAIERERAKAADLRKKLREERARNN